MELAAWLSLPCLLLPLVAQQETATKTHFDSEHTVRTGTIHLAGPIDTVFPLFGPVRESEWAPGWEPRVLWPVDKLVAEGMVFVVKETPGDVYWVVTRYEPDRHVISYANVLPGGTLNQIHIQCSSAGRNETECRIQYRWVAIGDAGNRTVEKQTEEAFAAKMSHWQTAINHRLETGSRIEAH